MSKETAAEIGEVALIATIQKSLSYRGDVVTGVGDDCAVVRAVAESKEDLVLKSDPVIRGRHFLATDDPYFVGSKAVNRVLSDIAAMGAVPRWLLVNLVAPADTEVVTITEMYRGMNAVAESCGCSIVGGDTAKGPELELHVFGCGTLPRGAAILRSGANPGDAVYVTGTLGGSLASGRHLTFSARVREGIWLRDFASAMIDVSDGLASELRHVAVASGVRMVIDEAAIPSTDSGTAALYDGEDFELLFTVAPEKVAALEAQWARVFPETRLSRIGVVEDSATRAPVVAFSDGRAIDKTGFDHYLS